MAIAGIDYSLTCPAICVFTGEQTDRFTYDSGNDECEQYANKSIHLQSPFYKYLIIITFCIMKACGIS